MINESTAGTFGQVNKPSLSTEYLEGAHHRHRDRLACFRLVSPAQARGLPAEVYVLLNPPAFTESWEPQYARRGTLGGSQEVLQYIRTATRSISLDLWISWQVYIQTGMVDVPDKGPLHYRDYFAALTVPTKARGTPPIVELEWPGADLFFRGVVDSIVVDYERFTEDGAPVEYTIRLRMIEHSMKLRTSAGVFRSSMGYNAEE